MDDFETKVASERVKQKIAEANADIRTHLAPIQDHILFTFQKTYFKCAYECYGRSTRRQEINNCIQNCRIPFSNAKQKTLDNEKANYQENLSRSLMVCKQKYEAAKLQKKTEATNDMVSCANQAIQDSIKKLPLHANKLKAAFGISDNSSF